MAKELFAEVDGELGVIARVRVRVDIYSHIIR